MKCGVVIIATLNWLICAQLRKHRTRDNSQYFFALLQTPEKAGTPLTGGQKKEGRRSALRRILFCDFVAKITLRAAVRKRRVQLHAADTGANELPPTVVGSQ